MTKADAGGERSGDQPAQPGPLAQAPHRAGLAEEAAKLKEMQARLNNTLRRSPVVLEQQRQRTQDIQLRIADWITAFAGSMNFVYLHIVLFTLWMLFIESKPWPTLTPSPPSSTTGCWTGPPGSGREAQRGGPMSMASTSGLTVAGHGTLVI